MDIDDSIAKIFEQVLKNDNNLPIISYPKNTKLSRITDSYFGINYQK